MAAVPTAMAVGHEYKTGMDASCFHTESCVATLRTLATESFPVDLDSHPLLRLATRSLCTSWESPQAEACTELRRAKTLDGIDERVLMHGAHSK